MVILVLLKLWTPWATIKVRVNDDLNPKSSIGGPHESRLSHAIDSWCGTLDGRSFGWSMDPTCDQTSQVLKSGNLPVHSLPGRHHTLGCRPGELDVDLPGRHPAVSPVDIMAVMSTGSTETWCQAPGGFCRNSSVSGRHHGCDVDRVHYISALF